MALGPCGCTDYHVADCPLMTANFSDPPKPPEGMDYDFLRDDVDLEDEDEDEWL